MAKRPDSRSTTWTTDTEEFIRTVGPDTLGPTDLASVPGPLRWFVNSYGAHTPAALIHDRLIGNTERPAELTDQMADRYFRFMLKSVNVSWLRRWMMWAAIAIRTRWASQLVQQSRTGALGAAVHRRDDRVGASRSSPRPGFSPESRLGCRFVAAVLWGRQYTAGLVATLAAPWLLPPTVLAAAGYLVYLVLEAITGGFAGGKLTFKLQPDAPHRAAATEEPAADRPAQPAGMHSRSAPLHSQSLRRNSTNSVTTAVIMMPSPIRNPVPWPNPG